MSNYDKYRLTEVDIQNGINDFLTQLLIEAKRQKKDSKTFSDLSSDKPTIIYVAGQPGSGKTTLGKFLQQQYVNKGECAIEVGSDKIATYHKYYDELLTLLPNECYTISREFVKCAKPIIYDQLMANKLNIIRESSLTKGEKDYSAMQRFRDNDYDVQINIMAVDRYESFLSCIERDIKLLELGFDPRPVARSNHDRMYEPLLHELIEIQKRGISSSVNIYTKSKTSLTPQLAWQSGSSKYSNAQEAIICERNKNRRSLLQNSQSYLQRIINGRRSIELMISEDRLKASYLEGLRQLEAEFLNELAFEKNK